MPQKRGQRKSTVEALKDQLDKLYAKRDSILEQIEAAEEKYRTALAEEKKRKNESAISAFEEALSAAGLDAMVDGDIAAEAVRLYLEAHKDEIAAAGGAESDRDAGENASAGIGTDGDAGDPGGGDSATGTGSGGDTEAGDADGSDGDKAEGPHGTAGGDGDGGNGTPGVPKPGANPPSPFHTV